MKKALSLGVVLLAVLSFAGETRKLGLLVTSGPAVTNWANDAGTAVTDAGFPLVAGMKLTLQCSPSSVDVLVNTIVQSDGGPYQGVTVDPAVYPLFPTSIDPGLNSGYISMIPHIYDAGIHQCTVFQRSGTE